MTNDINCGTILWTLIPSFIIAIIFKTSRESNGFFNKDYDTRFLKHDINSIIKKINNQKLNKAFGLLLNKNSEKSEFSIKTVINNMKITAKEKNISLQVKIQDFSINGDKNAVYLLFFNLLKNSQRAMIGKKIKKIEISHEYNRKYHYIFFKDYGSGIIRKDLFRIFYGHSTKPQHFGLGLTFSRQVMHSLGGDIEVYDSKPGEHVIFKLTFPKISKKPIKKAFAKLEYNKL